MHVTNYINKINEKYETVEGVEENLERVKREGSEHPKTQVAIEQFIKWNLGVWKIATQPFLGLYKLTTSAPAKMELLEPTGVRAIYSKDGKLLQSAQDRKKYLEGIVKSQKEFETRVNEYYATAPKETAEYAVKRIADYQQMFRWFTSEYASNKPYTPHAEAVTTDGKKLLDKPADRGVVVAGNAKKTQLDQMIKENAEFAEKMIGIPKEEITSTNTENMPADQLAAHTKLSALRSDLNTKKAKLLLPTFTKGDVSAILHATDNILGNIGTISNSRNVQRIVGRMQNPIRNTAKLMTEVPKLFDSFNALKSIGSFAQGLTSAASFVSGVTNVISLMTGFFTSGSDAEMIEQLQEMMQAVLESVHVMHKDLLAFQEDVRGGLIHIDRKLETILDNQLHLVELSISIGQNTLRNLDRVQGELTDVIKRGLFPTNRGIKEQSIRDLRVKINTIDTASALDKKQCQDILEILDFYASNLGAYPALTNPLYSTTGKNNLFSAFSAAGYLQYREEFDAPHQAIGFIADHISYKTRDGTMQGHKIPHPWVWMDAIEGLRKFIDRCGHHQTNILERIPAYKTLGEAYLTAVEKIRSPHVLRTAHSHYLEKTHAATEYINKIRQEKKSIRSKHDDSLVVIADKYKKLQDNFAVYNNPLPVSPRALVSLPAGPYQFTYWGSPIYSIEQIGGKDDISRMFVREDKVEIPVEVRIAEQLRLGSMQFAVYRSSYINNNLNFVAFYTDSSQGKEQIRTLVFAICARYDYYLGKYSKGEPLKDTKFKNLAIRSSSPSYSATSIPEGYKIDDLDGYVFHNIKEFDEKYNSFDIRTMLSYSKFIENAIQYNQDEATLELKKHVISQQVRPHYRPEFLQSLPSQIEDVMLKEQKSVDQGMLDLGTQEGATLRLLLTEADAAFLAYKDALHLSGLNVSELTQQLQWPSVLASDKLRNGSYEIGNIQNVTLVPPDLETMHLNLLQATNQTNIKINPFQSHDQIELRMRFSMASLDSFPALIENRKYGGIAEQTDNILYSHTTALESAQEIVMQSPDILIVAHCFIHYFQKMLPANRFHAITGKERAHLKNLRREIALVKDAFLETRLDCISENCDYEYDLSKLERSFHHIEVEIEETLENGRITANQLLEVQEKVDRVKERLQKTREKEAVLPSAGNFDIFGKIRTIFKAGVSVLNELREEYCIGASLDDISDKV